MRITTLSTRGFRNLQSVDVEPSERLTLVVGDNAQGKTNLVEAIYYLSTLKPLRAGKLEEMVTWGEEHCRLRCTVEEEIGRELKVEIRSGRKVATVDEKRPRTTEEYSDVLKVVAFTPDDLEVAKGPGSTRRRWIDRAAFTRHSLYLAEHRGFDRALKARNKLLKEAREGGGGPPAELDVFDDAVARYGAMICKRRIGLLRELEEPVKDRFETISRVGQELLLRYESSALGPYDDLSDSLEESELLELMKQSLRDRRGTDLARGFTTSGPQADDVRLLLGGRDVRVFASQGQQRAAILALKIAEIENLRRALGRTPVLLLDDVSSELDPAKNRQLLDYLASFPGQALITTTDPGLGPGLGDDGFLRLEVEGGRLSRV